MKITLLTTEKIKFILLFLLVIAFIRNIQQPISTRWIAEEIQREVRFGTLLRTDDDGLERVFGVSRQTVGDYAAYVAASPLDASRLVVLRVKRVQDIEIVTKQLEAHGNALEGGKYLPDMLQNIKNRKLIVKGEWIMFAVTIKGDPEKSFIEIIEDDIRRRNGQGYANRLL